MTDNAGQFHARVASIAAAAVLLLVTRLAVAQGVVVERVIPGLAWERAGILPGDVVRGWQRLAGQPAGGARGVLGDWLDALEAEDRECARGGCRLEVQRGTTFLQVDVTSGRWGAVVRPLLCSNDLPLYLEGTRLLGQGQPAAGTKAWSELGRRAQARDQTTVARWVRAELGRNLMRRGRMEDGEHELALASELAAANGAPGAQAEVEYTVGSHRVRAGQLVQARASFARGVAAAGAADGPWLTAATGLFTLAQAEQAAGNWERAEQLHRRALAIRSRQAPASMAVANTLSELGVGAWSRDRLDAAEAAFERAATIATRCCPGSWDAAGTEYNLGLVAFDRDDLDLAESWLQRSLTTRRSFAPESLHVADALNALGNVAGMRGDLELAEARLREALKLYERVTPGSSDVSRVLSNLAVVAGVRGDIDLADRHLRASLAILQQLPVGQVERALAMTLNNLGIVARRRGELDQAETYLRQALAIKERLEPNSTQVASTLSNLGRVELDRGRPDAAAELFRRALALEEEVAPQGLGVADSLFRLAAIALLRGGSGAAEPLLRRALSIRARLAPGSQLEAEARQQLGRCLRAQGRLAEALEEHLGAVTALEAQIGRLGGTDTSRAEFRARNAEIYRDCVELLLELGRPEDAFSMVERSRARAFLDLLAERDLRFSVDVPEELDRERRSIATEHDRLLDRIADLGTAAGESELRQAEEALARLQARYEEVTERIRRASPRLAALQRPRSLDLAGVRAALDPGTAVLEYSLGSEASTLFVIAADGRFAALPLAAGRDQVRAQVEALRRLLARPRVNREAMIETGSALYRLLVAPAEPWLADAERVLVVPDGPLHMLPFAALTRKAQDEGSGDQYLLEWKPLHSAASVTVWAELKEMRRTAVTASKRTPLVAFGDPHYPQLSVIGEARSSRPPLAPLPGSRGEVLAVADLLGSGAVVHLGEEATEERAKALGRDVNLVHFACHGLLDESLPLDSALALALPKNVAEGQDNGLLQAWEILEQVRLDADLVTLSACETAVGAEMTGEGLISLARAFQYAGARSVLASLWNVADLGVGELMQGFYAGLAQGLPKDEALRQAQLEVVHGSQPSLPNDDETASRPFVWAAFQIIGDWR